MFIFGGERERQTEKGRMEVKESLEKSPFGNISKTGVGDVILEGPEFLGLISPDQFLLL